MPASKSVDGYIAKLPADVRAVLEKLRAQIRAAAPGATETISYQMPTFRYRGRALVGFAAFKGHCSLFPYSAALLDELGVDIGPARTSKGTLRFTAERPLPAALVKRIVRGRVREIDARLSTRG